MTKFFYLSKKTRRSGVNNAYQFCQGHIKVINIFIGGLILVIGTAYLIQVNAMVAKGYQIKELEVKIAQLQSESEQLELEASKLKSLETVKGKVENLQMVVADNVEHLDGSSVAVR